MNTDQAIKAKLIYKTFAKFYYADIELYEPIQILKYLEVNILDFLFVNVANK